MNHLTRAWAGVVLWAWLASAQMVPDRLGFRGRRLASSTI